MCVWCRYGVTISVWCSYDCVVCYYITALCFPLYINPEYTGYIPRVQLHLTVHFDQKNSSLEQKTLQTQQLKAQHIGLSTPQTLSSQLDVNTTNVTNSIFMVASSRVRS
ncbi:hypothetical protein CDAR_406961 [Caerostris darwini]|uniref:Uncharacterized protein n=1 Tax=Caerostris darwini TaxID=1538125 RepID=A0AAV4R716_9ARAC|nr:hypothetical protein CDAR_406961 [Caerostris darwini]